MLVVQAWVLLTMGEACRLAVLKYAFRQDVRERAHKSCGAIARWILNYMFDGYELVGLEHLLNTGSAKAVAGGGGGGGGGIGGEGALAKTVPVVLVANHQSMMDVAAVFALNLRTAWVAKTAVFMMPGVG